VRNRKEEQKEKKEEKGEKGLGLSLLSDYLSHSHRLCLSLFQIEEEIRRN